MTIHDCLLKLLDKFIDVCEKNNLNYFLDGGTLLGVVRDGKLIDWDDDVDIIMPREDFNKLQEISKQCFTDEFMYQTALNDNIFAVCPRLRLSSTTALTTREKDADCNKGIFLDVFPLDALPDDNTKINDIIGFLRTVGKHSRAEWKHAHSDCDIDLAATYRCIQDIITDVSKQYSDSKYVANVMLYRYSDYSYVKFRREAYSDYLLYRLEGLSRNVRIPIGFNEILCAWYGYDWKTARQESAGHGDVIYDPNVSYQTMEDK